MTRNSGAGRVGGPRTVERVREFPGERRSGTRLQPSGSSWGVIEGVAVDHGVDGRDLTRRFPETGGSELDSVLDYPIEDVFTITVANTSGHQQGRRQGKVHTGDDLEIVRVEDDSEWCVLVWSVPRESWIGAGR